MKIVVLIPIYKRPEITRICLKNLNWFIRSVSWSIEVVCLLSPEDCELKKNEKHVNDHGFKAIYYRNLPVSNKMNAGIEWIMRHKKFDYLMNLGSDDLIHPLIEDLYRPYFDKNYRFFGITSLYFTEYSTGKTIYFHTYNFNGSIGAGRMIHYSILKQFHGDQMPVYEPGLDCGLDTSSAMNIKRMTGVVDVGIECGKFPYIVDIKSDTNINLMMHLESRVNHIEESDYKIIKANYGL